MSRKIKLAPSLLSANFAQLAEEVKKVEEAGADWLHVDVMDGHFVPNLTIGPLVVKALRKVTGMPLDTHLMIEYPDQLLPDFIAAGSAVITVHAEACRHLHRTIHHIKQHGAAAGVSLNPATPVSCLEDILPDLDLVLLMSVNPGFGGQEFIPQVLNKIAKLRKLIDDAGLEVLIEVDGGVKPDNAASIASAGADVLVAGSAVFGSPDPGKVVHKFRRTLDNL